jgi:hypothetical protein
VKRLIGQFLVAGLLASGGAVALAGPSSAMPRDVCLDEQHYFQQVDWYEAMLSGEFDVMLSWGAPSYSQNPVSGLETWSTTLPSGTYVEVHMLAAVRSAQANASAAFDHTYYQYSEFLANNAPC